MAQQAYERAKKAMDLATEMHLARMVVQEASQLEERAKLQGVTAYLLKPVHRERPNERFLRNTISSVEFANRRKDEDEMWRMREQELAKERKRRHNHDDKYPKRRKANDSSVGCSKPDSREERENKMISSDTTMEPHLRRGPSGEGMNDIQIEAFLSQRRVRGRGAVGSRKDEPGPYLPKPLASDLYLEWKDYRDHTIDSQILRGPKVPELYAEELKANRQVSRAEDSDSLTKMGSKSKEEKKKKKQKKKDRKQKKNKQHKKKKKESKTS